MMETCNNCIFERVQVDFLMLGGARITWDVSPHLHAPAPWSFQLQVAESDVDGANWVSVGAPVTNSFFAIDPTRRAFGKELNVFYRVILTTGDSQQFISPVGVVMGNLDIRTWREAHEITRKELLRLKALRVGIDGFFLKVKRSGVECPDCIDQNTNIVTDSNCPTCYGTHWTGGYYDPVPAVFGDVGYATVFLSRDLEQGQGLNNPQEVAGMFVAMPYMSTNDVWVNKSSDLRYRITEVSARTYARGVPILSNAKLRPIPFDNVIYQFPVPR
jgi:hypothetical protein